ncbi:hypothetical protein EIP91_010584 [Steccherinum ochraceum]|uniref:Cytochrome P450 67 n=1 Tax=Steccherinum ochraceum TaxID=92696 RepID=A0A4R0RWW9_9APHY|nr:hypothetical protein EIP91_010584 [Steccherinum ochraceum]
MAHLFTPRWQPPATSLRDALFVISGSALITHLVFKRYEPLAIPVVASLLLIPPLALSFLLASHLDLLSAVFATLAVHNGILLASIACYRLSPFHPLARYPGPILLKLSAWWMYCNARGGKRHEYVQQLHTRYKADVIRIGPNELSICDPTAVVPILGPHGLTKGPAWDGHFPHTEFRPLISWRDSDTHAKARRPWNRAFSTAAVKEYEPTLAKRVAQLVDLVKKFAAKSGREKKVDMTLLFKYFSFDFMGDMAFGGGTELMRDGDPMGIIPKMRKSIDSGVMAEICPWFRYYVPDYFQEFTQMCVLRAQERIKNVATTKDVFHYLNNDDVDLAPPNPIMVVTEGSLVVVAGSDTVSATLSSILWCLLMNPDAYRRLQQEIDQCYPAGQDALDCAYSVEMKYLDAVINETMRLYPVVPSGDQRATKDKGMTVNSTYIPPYTSVRLHTWTMHRDPCNFYPFPTSFWPDRWLLCQVPTAKYPKDFVHNTDAFHPFSYGPTGCVGKNLAMKELRMVLCGLLQQVDVAFPKGYDPLEWERGLKDPFTLQTGPLEVLLKVRRKV